MKRIFSVFCLFLGRFISTSSAYASEHLVIANAPTLLTGLLNIAMQKGYFTEQGLDVEIITAQTGDAATRAMFDGKVDIANRVATTKNFIVKCGIA